MSDVFRGSLLKFNVEGYTWCRVLTRVANAYDTWSFGIEPKNDINIILGFEHSASSWAPLLQGCIDMDIRLWYSFKWTHTHIGLRHILFKWHIHTHNFTIRSESSTKHWASEWERFVDEKINKNKTKHLYLVHQTCLSKPFNLPWTRCALFWPIHLVLML